MLAEILSDFGAGESAGGLLAALPCLCFGLFGLLAVPLSRRIGFSGTLVIALALLVTGLLLRPLTSSFVPFLALTTLALIGPSLGNVVAPAWIKRHGGSRTVLLMTVYSVVLSAGAALAPALSAWLETVGEGGWRTSLQAWGLVALVPLVLAVIALARTGNDFPRRSTDMVPPDGLAASDAVSASDVPSAGLSASDASSADLPPTDVPPTGAPRAQGPQVSLFRSPAARWLTLMFGLQSMNAYTQFGYVPRILTDAGIAPADAGNLMAQIAGWGVLGGLVMPTVIARTTRLHVWAVVFGILTAAGYVGLALQPAAAPVLWSALLGIGGFAFPTAIAMIPARTRDPLITARLSAMAQPVGYLIAGCGPLLLGALLQQTGSMVLVLWLLAGSGVLLAIAGWRAGSAGMIDDDLESAGVRGR